jgi:hypothetical protein
MTTMTIADDRVDDLQASMNSCMQALERITVIEREIDEIREALCTAVDTAYNITLSDRD